MLPVWRLHRHVGMGGDKYVAAVAGEEVEERLGDELRDRWEGLFDELIGEVAPLEGARDLIADLKEHGRTVVLASSSIQRHLDHYLDLLDARELLDAGARPGARGAREGGTGDATMLGDTPWDVEAARKAGLETVCLVTGGFSAQELREAGAAAVFESVGEVRERLDDVF